MLLATMDEVICEYTFSIPLFCTVLITISIESQIREVPYRPINVFTFMNGKSASTERENNLTEVSQIPGSFVVSRI